MATQSSVFCPNCKNDLWDIYQDEARCSNCSYKRPYHTRKRRDDYITPSQHKRLTLIKRYFDGSKYSEDAKPTTELTKWETQLQEGTGTVYLSVKTGKSIFTESGGYFAIGRRGGLRVLSSYGITDHKHTERHYANILGGKVGW